MICSNHDYFTIGAGGAVSLRVYGDQSNAWFCHSVPTLEQLYAHSDHVDIVHLQAPLRTRSGKGGHHANCPQ